MADSGSEKYLGKYLVNRAGGLPVDVLLIS